MIQVEKARKEVTDKQEKKLNKVRARIKRNRYRERVLSNELQVSDKFYSDKEIISMRSHITDVSHITYRNS